MYVVIERGRDVSGNTPVMAVYGLYKDTQEAMDQADLRTSQNGQDRFYSVYELTDETLKAPKEEAEEPVTKKK